MKRLLIIAFALCSLSNGCHKEDTEIPAVWLHPADLKPAATAWQPSATPPECDEVVDNRVAAVQMLTTQPLCTDAAVAALERFAAVEPLARSDLAAGYALRALREDRPTDLLNALESAQQATTATPQPRAAWSNRAFIEESLGLSTEAIESWNEFLKIGDASKTAEAREHRNLLMHRADSAAQWTEIRAQLPAALRAHDDRAITRLISLSPASAQRFLEDELLATEHLEAATTLANALSRLVNDRYDVDVVAATKRSPESLREANRAFAVARAADRALSPNRTPLYEAAARLLDRSGSPLALLARVGAANGASVGSSPNASEQAIAALDPIEREAREHSYRRLIALIQSTRANLRRKQGRFVESVAESDAALAEYGREHDTEKIADTRMRRIGTFRQAGQNALAWREGMLALPLAEHLADAGNRHLLLGEIASTAVVLGHPRIALLYQNTALRLLRRALVATPPEQTADLKNLEAHLGVVNRERAEIELHLGQYDRASADLNEAIRLKAPKMDPNAQRMLQARIEEVRGQSLMHIHPAKAAIAFSAALRAAGVERKTIRAGLLAQRAEAQRRAGNSAAAEQDLRAALDELRVEESNVLEHRKPGTGEDIWSSYFSRFSEAYKNLIRQLLNTGRKEEAFDYTERQRAFEPLYLLSETAPDDFDGTLKNLALIRQSLPPGTLLLEYSLLGDQAVAWPISRERFEAIPLSMPSRDIERHATALQRAANVRNTTDFEAQSYVLYNALIAEPLANSNAPRRLVIVPEGPLHGLPFAALRNPNTRRYLIQDAPIEIAGSANLYLTSLARDRALASDTAVSALLIGDPAFDASLTVVHGLKPLPHARTECETIYPLYPHAEMLLERDATIPRFLERARSSAVIHIAAHSIVNAQLPSRSFIVFASSVNQPGPLEAQALVTDLSALHHTRLVVLSTCSSAGGLPIGAEGVAPFVRPLIGAGVPAVVGTLWNVEDATAEKVLVSFHRHYREGSDAAVALRQAQVDLLSNNNKHGLRPVLAWAPFQVIGHSSSPFKAPPQQKEKPP